MCGKNMNDYQFKIVPSTKVIRVDEGRVFRISTVDGLLQDPVLYARPVAQDSTQLLIMDSQQEREESIVRLIYVNM